MTTERPFLFTHILQVSKWSLRNLILYTFLMILYMYIAPGQGQKTPWGQTFDVNRKPLSLWPFVASFKQISLNSATSDIQMHRRNNRAASWQNQQNGMCAQWRLRSAWASAHLTPGPGIYFNVFIHVYSPRAGADNLLGTNVEVNRKPLLLCPFVAGLKKIAFKSDFYTFFHVSPYIYSPG